MYFLNIPKFDGHDDYLEFFVLKEDDNGYFVLNEDEGGGWIEITKEEFDALKGDKEYETMEDLEDVTEMIEYANDVFVYKVAKHYRQDIREKIERIKAYG